MSSDNQSVGDIAPVDDGSGDIYVGELESLAGQRARIWKLHPNGSVDGSFAQGQINFTGDAPITPTMIFRIVPIGDRSGRAYVCGQFDRYNGMPVSHMVLVTPTGTLDPTFLSTAATPISNIFPADDGTGDLYVTNFRLTGPSSGGPGTVYRLNADGSIDSGFTPLSAGVAGFDGSINAALPVGDGSGDIFVGGSTIYLGTGVPAPTTNPDGFRGLVRLNSDGTFDLTSPTPPVPGGVFHMSRAVDGTRDILISDGVQLMRFKGDASRDPGFVTGTVTGPRSLIFALLPLNDGTGDLYVGGDVMTYNGVSAGNVVRLNANGTLDGS
jgi:hypothetical protein